MSLKRGRRCAAQISNTVNSVATAALTSWNLDPRVIGLLLLVALVYVRGWMRGRRLVRHEQDAGRLAAFLGGLAAVFLATESPLDAFDNLFLSAHMAQHLLLLMIAPPLLLLGHPMLPLLRGLPKAIGEGRAGAVPGVAGAATRIEISDCATFRVDCFCGQHDLVAFAGAV